MKEPIDRRSALRDGTTAAAGGLVALLGLQKVLRSSSVDVEELSRKATAVHREFAEIERRVKADEWVIAEIGPHVRMAEVLAMTAQLAVELRDVKLD